MLRSLIRTGHAQRGERHFSPRGFEIFYKGKDSYGADVQVYESSAVAPHIWVAIDGGSVENNRGHAHLTHAGAIALAEALLAACEAKE